MNDKSDLGFQQKVSSSFEDDMLDMRDDILNLCEYIGEVARVVNGISASRRHGLSVAILAPAMGL